LCRLKAEAKAVKLGGLPNFYRQNWLKRTGACKTSAASHGGRSMIETGRCHVGVKASGVVPREQRTGGGRRKV